MEMDDYSALAQRIAVTVSGVRGSLILSRDGLVLGSFPENDEGPAKSAWLKFVTLGEPDKSFVEFPDQVWAFVKRGPYAAFSVAEPGTRPGILVDQMEQVLLAAEEGRSKREAVRLPDAASAPSGKPRTSLHPAADKPQAEEVVAAIPAADEFMEAPPGEGHWRRGPDASEPSFANSGGGDASASDPPLTASEAPSLPTESPVGGSGEAADAAAASALTKEPKKLVSAASEGGGEDDAEVDRVLLAKEFSGLLQVDSGDDEASS
jgi:hypothetical protein